ncbi:hypothetical protein PybrP1_012520 [[Pythium] brassicae (nom. inval.)]|nr:hypothetical protein PybrP1_012520 [[Pythium] brassicae (nom. inval.)]
MGVVGGPAVGRVEERRRGRPRALAADDRGRDRVREALARVRCGAARRLGEEARVEPLDPVLVVAHLHDPERPGELVLYCHSGRRDHGREHRQERPRLCRHEARVVDRRVVDRPRHRQLRAEANGRVPGDEDPLGGAQWRQVRRQRGRRALHAVDARLVEINHREQRRHDALFHLVRRLRGGGAVAGGRRLLAVFLGVLDVRERDRARRRHVCAADRGQADEHAHDAERDQAVERGAPARRDVVQRQDGVPARVLPRPVSGDGADDRDQPPVLGQRRKALERCRERPQDERTALREVRGDVVRRCRYPRAAAVGRDRGRRRKHRAREHVQRAVGQDRERNLIAARELAERKDAVQHGRRAAARRDDAQHFDGAACSELAPVLRVLAQDRDDLHAHVDERRQRGAAREDDLERAEQVRLQQRPAEARVVREVIERLRAAEQHIIVVARGEEAQRRRDDGGVLDHAVVEHRHARDVAERVEPEEVLLAVVGRDHAREHVHEAARRHGLARRALGRQVAEHGRAAAHRRRVVMLREHERRDERAALDELHFRAGLHRDVHEARGEPAVDVLAAELYLAHLGDHLRDVDLHEHVEHRRVARQVVERRDA